MTKKNPTIHNPHMDEEFKSAEDTLQKDDDVDFKKLGLSNVKYDPMFKWNLFIA